jgi:hypothetical protein
LEITGAVEAYSKETLIKLLLEQQVKDLTADEVEVERLYREAVKEWKIKSILFKKEAEAKKIESLLKADKNFDHVVASAVAEGVAEGGQEEFLKDKDLTAPVAKLVSKMETGSISPVVSSGKENFIIFKLLGVRLPEHEDTAARQSARLQALNRKRVEAAKAYTDELWQRYIKIDETLLESLDFESGSTGFETLLQDKRVVAEITGEKPVTVGDLAAALKKKFFHGIESAVRRKTINTRKRETLETILKEQLFLKEALSQGLDKTEDFKNRVKEYENSMLFSAFIQKVVTPEIKLDRKELETYYRENSKRYSSPEMIRIKSLVFGQKGAAEDALVKLSAGTDFNWLGAHAAGQLDPGTKGLLTFNGNLLITDSLPKDLQQSVAGAKIGDFRLYSSPEGHYYVLYIYQVVAPEPQSFESVKTEIAKTVFNENLSHAIDLWAKRLKEFYPVIIYSDDLKK